MNRLKKEIRKKGIKLSCDYPCLPYYIKGRSCFEPGHIFIEDVFVNSERATITQFYNVMDIVYQVNRDGSIKEVEVF